MTEDTSDVSKNTRLKRAAVVILFLALAGCVIGLAVALVASQRANPPPPPTSRPPPPATAPPPVGATSAWGAYRHAAVAADSQLCSQIGTDILARQGSAMDAAIAALICNGVVQSQSMGIGGGFFMTIHDKSSGETVSLVSREVAPLAATQDMYVNGTASSTVGGMAIAVPGEVAGYEEAWRRFGRLPWASLFEPTIRLCRQGFPVTDYTAFAAQIALDDIKTSTHLKDLLLRPDGTPVQEGDVMRRPRLAQTLQRIADGGAEVFYNGSLADDVVADIAEHGGIITSGDLEQYRPVWKEPVTVHLSNGDFRLYGPPPPSSAAVLAYMLNILDGYDLSPEDMAGSVGRQVLTYHRVTEAMKFGFAKRSHLGDEDYWNVTEWLSRLQSDDYADDTRRKINDSGVLAFDDYEAGFEIVNDGGTSHMSVLSPDGSAVAVTSTINLFWGSTVMGNRTGIVFNNQMDDFSTPGTVNTFGVSASPSNFIAPGKRPMSSMAPLIVLDRQGHVATVSGAAGGTWIISGTLQATFNSLWLGMTAQEAVDDPRYHHQLLPDYIHHEPLPQAILDGLAAKGHLLHLFVGGPVSEVQLIRNRCADTAPNSTDASAIYTRECVFAACDFRKGGAPDGF